MSKLETEWNVYLQSALIGSLQGLITLPLEHPLDVVKTRMQSMTKPGSFINEIKVVYRQFGVVKGFYAGAIPNGIRVLLKSFYRWPMMVAFPQFLKDYILPTSFQKKFDSSHKVGAGLMIAIFESFIICPFERLKVFLMTKSITNNAKTNSSLKIFFEKIGNTKGLFVGLEAQLTKQIVSWVSFLYLDHQVKKTVKYYFSPDKQTLSNQQLLSSALIVGVLNTLCTLPIDKIKTLYQMQINDSFKAQSMNQVFKNVIKSSGIVGLYSGWQLRMTQYLIQSLFTCTLLERMEERLQKVKNSKL